jgi:murein L,D-transpeptidase YcbB/YkuD
VDAGQTKTVFLPAKIPILIMYFTAVKTGQGELQFREDVYERDEAILKGLDRPVAPSLFVRDLLRELSAVPE